MITLMSAGLPASLPYAVYETLQHINIGLAILTYMTWLMGSLVFRGSRGLHALFVWLLVGYSILYGADIGAMALAIEHTRDYQEMRLIGARLTVLGATWRTLWLAILRDVLWPSQTGDTG